MQTKSSLVEGVVAIALATLAIGSFVLQAASFDGETTQRETVLFNTLQFILTVGFGWFSTRAISKSEFERSLKRFAVGAYRRITDIEAMLERLSRSLSNGRVAPENRGAGSLEATQSVLEDAIQVVRSSTADWADVIGEELLTIDSIKRLRQEKSELASSSAPLQSTSLDEKLATIDKQIEKLVQRLPVNLQVESRRIEDEERIHQHRVDWMRDRHETEQGLRLKVIAGGQYKCEEDVKSLMPDTELFLKTGAKGEGVVIHSSLGRLLGRALNNSPLSYDEFRETLARCFGTDRIPIKFVKHVAERKLKHGAELRWYDVRVTGTPVARSSQRLRKSRPESHD